MKLYQAVTLTALVSGCTLLAACSGPNHTTAYNGRSAQSGAQGAQAYRANRNGNYQYNGSGAHASSNFYPRNSRTAPSDQTYYFAFNSSKLLTDELAAMQIQARYLATHPRASIRLEGNTDNRGSREYNVGLGWRRDQTVERYFEQQGVSPKQIQMISYGKEHPAVRGNNERAWALNRRVNLKYKG
ncbi:MAG: OmpA family protein [Gammaproteobacteria bacterium]|nr:OmpA family protein [Gammaproteobacteria bacterium]